MSEIESADIMATAHLVALLALVGGIAWGTCIRSEAVMLASFVGYLAAAASLLIGMHWIGHACYD